MLNQGTHIQRIILRGLIISQSQSKGKPVSTMGNGSEKQCCFHFKCGFPSRFQKSVIDDYWRLSHKGMVLPPLFCSRVSSNSRSNKKAPSLPTDRRKGLGEEMREAHFDHIPQSAHARGLPSFIPTRSSPRSYLKETTRL